MLLCWDVFSPGGGPERYRIYLLDESGEKIPLVEDEQISCFNAVPLVPRRRKVSDCCGVRETHCLSRDLVRFTHPTTTTQSRHTNFVTPGTAISYAPFSLGLIGGLAFQS